MNITTNKIAAGLAAPFLMLGATHAQEQGPGESLTYGENAVIIENQPARPIPDAMTLTDREVLADVERSLRYEAKVPFDVHAHVNKGTVVLTGAVEHEAARSRAEAAALRRPGVLAVRNLIYIPGGINIMDDRLSTDVAAALTRVENVEQVDVTASTEDGIVVLEGWVPSAESKEEILLTVSSVRGVTYIADNLQYVSTAAFSLEGK